MIYSEFKKEDILEIDLHKMRYFEAWNYLDNIVSNAPKNIREIVVIHGYHNGNYLLNLVRKNYKNKRIKRKYLSLNEGITSLILC